MASELYESLMGEYRRLAKRADQRLVRIERYAGKREAIKGESSIKGMENLTSYAYASAMRDIQSWSGAGADRFNTKPPATTNELKAKIADIKRFLGSATSTVAPTPTNKTGGVYNVYQNRVNTINSRYGTDFTWEQLAEFYKSSLYKKLDSKKDSSTVLRIIGVIQENEDDVKEALSEHKPIHLTVDNDIILEEEANKTLRYYKKDLSKLLM